MPGNGLLVVNLSDREAADNYGVVTVQPGSPNSLFASVLRRKNPQYVLPSPVRQ